MSKISRHAVFMNYVVNKVKLIGKHKRVDFAQRRKNRMVLSSWQNESTSYSFAFHCGQNVYRVYHLYSYIPALLIDASKYLENTEAFQVNFRIISIFDRF